MKIIAGLGNPGLRYRNTRHNVGFMVIDALAKKHRISVRKKGFQGVYGIGRIARKEVMLFKPLTYVNLSGSAVKSVCASRIDDKEDFLAVSDEINLPLGRIRLRRQGSSGGHNGLQSIIDQIGPDFPRLRVGVKNTDVIEDMVAYVLSPFPRKERAVLSEAVEEAVGSVETWVAEGIAEAIRRYNK